MASALIERVPARPLSHLSKHRYAYLAVFDAMIWVVVLPTATVARFDFDLSQFSLAGLGAAMLTGVVVQVLVGWIAGLYRGWHRIGSFEEVAWIAFTAAANVLVLFVVLVAGREVHLVPRSAILAAGAYQLVGALAIRYVGRLLLEKSRRSGHFRSRRLLVFGAGEAGVQAVKALREDPTTDLMPVAFLDDSPLNVRLKIAGLRIAGGRTNIADVAEEFGAQVLLVAIPSGRRTLVAEIADEAQRAGLEVRVLPGLDELVADKVQSSDIRDITLADFLSRDEVKLDHQAVDRYVRGKTILVTGAAGSIGSQLCESLREFHPERLVMVDHSENGLWGLQMKLDGRALLTNEDLVLADIRDGERIMQLVSEVMPDVIFHAAAHKHVTFLDRFPREAIKTNVFGTRNLLEAAAKANVERFVNVSTDKAADPANVLGYTKRVGERLTSAYGARSSGQFISVRFGNVIGSEGSVLPTFRRQIAAGVPLTVTHPDVTRFFMTIGEAVQLVLQAGAVGASGDVLVLQMGQPVKIVDLARRLTAEISPGTVPEIEFIGLRPGEKMDEVLVNAQDKILDQPHDLLFRYSVPQLAPASVDGLNLDVLNETLIAQILEMSRSGVGEAQAEESGRVG